VIRVLIAIALVGLAQGGCGGGEEAPPPPAPPPTPASLACEAVSTADVQRAISAAGGERRPLRESANDSLHLSSCEFRERSGPDLYVEVTVDTAAQAAYRYYVLLAEGRQRATFPAIPDSSKPIGIRKLGDDGVNGGVGAFWVRLTSQLTAYADHLLVKVAVHVPGLDSDRSRQAAIPLARQALGA
jgi:hypothetical protein